MSGSIHIQMYQDAITEYPPGPARDLLIDLIETQREKGLAKYGEPLTKDTDVDLVRYAAEEMTDNLAYLLALVARKTHGDQLADFAEQMGAALWWFCCAAVEWEQAGVDAEIRAVGGGV